MFRGILLALLLVPVSVSALDLKLGLMQTAEPFYDNQYDEYIDDDGVVGRVEISQRFKFHKSASFNIFAVHMSLFNERDPHYGINAIGAELEFNFQFLK